MVATERYHSDSNGAYQRKGAKRETALPHHVFVSYKTVHIWRSYGEAKKEAKKAVVAANVDIMPM